MSFEKERVAVTLTGPYLDALDLLVEKGVYLERQVVIRAALRLLFTSHRIYLIYPPEAEPIRKLLDIEKEEV